MLNQIIETLKRYPRKTYERTFIGVLGAVTLVAVGWWCGQTFPASEFLRQGYDEHEPTMSPPPPPFDSFGRPIEGASTLLRVDPLRSVDDLKQFTYYFDIADLPESQRMIPSITLTNGTGVGYICPDTAPCTAKNAHGKVEATFMGAVATSTYGADRTTVMGWIGTGVMTLTLTDKTNVQVIGTISPQGTSSVYFSGAVVPVSQGQHVVLKDMEQDTATFIMAGRETKTYIFEQGTRRMAPRVIELANNNTEKILRTTDGLSFHYPFNFMESDLWGDRAIQVEESSGKSPVYFDGSCGLEPGFADNAFTFGAYSEGDDANWVSANLSVHDTAAKNPAYLTTAYFGYDPSQWGTIRRTVDTAKYAQSIVSGDALSGRDAELVSIGGIPMRHIKPFLQPRPCDTTRQEQYQWILQNRLFTFTIQSPVSHPYPVELLRTLLATIARSMTVTRQ